MQSLVDVVLFYVLVQNKRDPSSSMGWLLSCACFVGQVVCCCGALFALTATLPHQKSLSSPAFMLKSTSFKLKLTAVLLK